MELSQEVADLKGIKSMSLIIEPLSSKSNMEHGVETMSQNRSFRSVSWVESMLSNGLHQHGIWILDANVLLN